MLDLLSKKGNSLAMKNYKYIFVISVLSGT